MLRTAGKFRAIEGGITKVPGDPVPSTRQPCPSTATSPSQRNIIDRVARVSRVSLAENFTGLPASSVLPEGSTKAYGTFCGLVSISCTRGTSRESNLYDFSIDSLRPSRATISTQGWLLSGASPVKCSPLYFFCSTDSPVAGLNHHTS